jgi:hypothetical protein
MAIVTLVSGCANAHPGDGTRDGADFGSAASTLPNLGHQ